MPAERLLSSNLASGLLHVNSGNTQQLAHPAPKKSYVIQHGVQTLRAVLVLLSSHRSHVSR